MTERREVETCPLTVDDIQWCWHCNGSARVYDIGSCSYRVRCTICQASGPVGCSATEAIERWNTRATRTPPTGYVMVPEEPSEAMKLAGARSIGATIGRYNHNERSDECYRAMLAAASEKGE